MLWAVVIAFIAVAIAIGLAVAGLRQIVEVRDSLGSLRGELAEAVERGAEQAGETARKKVDWALTQLDISRKKYDEAVGSQRQHSGLLYLSADADVTKAGDLAAELANYTLRDLEHQASTGLAPLILRGGLYSGQPAVLDVVPDLITAFIGALGAELLYSQDDGTHGRKFYVRWPAGADDPASLLGSLLGTPASGDHTAGPDSAAGEPGPESELEPEPALAAAGDGSSGPVPAADDAAEPAPAVVTAPGLAASGNGSGPARGAAELEALLDAVRHGHPAVLHLGPLVVMNTQAGIAAGFALPGWKGLTADQQKTAVTGVGANLLTQIKATGITDLSQ